MFQDIDLRELAELQGPERAFLTLYLPDQAAANEVDRRADEARALLAGHGGELEQLDHNLDLAREILARHDFDSGSLAVFVCWVEDFARGYPIEADGVPAVFDVGPCFHLRPLAELQDEHERFAAVTASHSGAEIWLVSLPRIDRADRIGAEIKNHVKKGGWSQKRYQRRRREQLAHFVDEVVEHLGRLREKAEFDRLVLLGAHDVIARLRDALPGPLAETLVGTSQADLEEPEAAIRRQGAELAAEAERTEERELWARIRDDALGQRLGATGPAAVLESLIEGRAEVLLVDRTLERAAVRCRACEHPSVGDPDRCPRCGAADPMPTDLVNQLVELAELSHAAVDFVDASEDLDRVGGVAALLRY